MLHLENFYPFTYPFLHSVIFLLAPTVWWALFGQLALQSFSPETWKRSSEVSKGASWTSYLLGVYSAYYKKYSLCPSMELWSVLVSAPLGVFVCSIFFIIIILMW